MEELLHRRDGMINMANEILVTGLKSLRKRRKELR